jgi:2',3'-cyclic-nucleotide 2'-phosphodiesterase (5'-nucleotidase family)
MIRESRALREAGADIVVMITHVGADCTARGPNAEGKNEK